MLTASFALATALIALAIVLDAAALVVWDIGTRSPFRLAADIAAGVRQKSSLAWGLVRFATGTVAMLAAATIVGLVTGSALDFTVVESWTIVIALALEQLVGSSLRTRRE